MIIVFSIMDASYILSLAYIMVVHQTSIHIVQVDNKFYADYYFHENLRVVGFLVAGHIIA